MLTAVAQIETERPSRYLVQLCQHAAAMAGKGAGHRPRMHAGRNPAAQRDVQVHAEWSEADGSISFDPWGLCTITATAGTLTLRVQAIDEEALGLIQDVLSNDVDRFGRRESLTTKWQRPETPEI